MKLTDVGNRIVKNELSIAEAVEQMDSFISANMFTSLQLAIDYAIAHEKTLYVPDGTYTFPSDSTGLLIDGQLTWFGSQRVILDFSAMTSGFAITIGKEHGVSRVVMDGFYMKGNSNINGIRLNTSETNEKACVDLSFKNARISYFNIALMSGYSWCNYFENIRFFNNERHLALNSQSNDFEFNRCSLVSSRLASTLKNCGGINFTSPNIANCETSAFSIFQSNISIINPYYEYITQYLAVIGSTSEIGKSTLTSIGGQSTDTELKICLAGNNCGLLLKNLNRTSKFIVDNDLTQQKNYIKNIEVDSSEIFEDNFITKWDGTTPIPFNYAYNGTTVLQELNRLKYTSLTLTSAGYSGFKIANNLVIGNRYVLVYNIKSVKPIPLQNDDNTIGAIPTNSNNFETRYFPFIATGAILKMVWEQNGIVDVSFIGVVDGNKFPQIPKNKGELYSTSIPTLGTWNIGDRILNSSPSAGGYSGWTCIASGTPGTWKGFGLIQA